MKNLIAALFLGALVAIAQGATDATFCTFENGVCNWVNGGNDEWLWSNSLAGGPADKPVGDVTLGTSAGYYVYADLNANNIDSPTFISPEIQTGTYCGKLSMYVSDASAASLEVSILSASGARTQATVVTNSVDGAWVEASMDIHENDPFKIQLTALKNDPNSDAIIALDEIHLVHGHCH